MNSQREPTVTGLLYKTYSAAASIVAPVALPLLRFSQRGRLRMSDRAGEWGAFGPVDWWLHGASVGEVQGLLPLMGALREHGKAGRILLTATSPTGLERGTGAADVMRLAPLDAPRYVRRAIDQAMPRRFLSCETELWPVLLHELAQRGIRCDLINARISDYTVRRYGMIRSLFGPLVEQFTSICVASEGQRDRFLSLGCPVSCIHVTGNTKYDTHPRFASPSDTKQIRENFFPEIEDDTPIVVLGSVRPKEESEWLHAFNEMREAGVTIKMVIAPRHAEKFNFFASILETQKWPWARWSEGSVKERDLLLLDTMGKLEEAYSVASLAFIGATLVDIGGHNPFEPAMYGVPVCVGPFVRNIRDIVDEMQDVEGIIPLSSAADISRVMNEVVSPNRHLIGIGERGQSVWSKHVGATERVLAVLMEETGEA